MKKIITITALCIAFLLHCGQIFLYAQSCELEIFHTNDVHGRLLPFELGISDYSKEIGGIARRKTLINKLKEKSKNAKFLTLDAGDIAQGTIFFNLYSGIPDVQFLNKLEYDAATIGNHEFDKGEEVISKMIEVAEFPFLAANLKFKKTSPLYDKVKPYVIKDLGCCKVGIIGLITPEIKIISNIGSDTEVLDYIKTTNKYIKEIDKNTDVIIVLSHLGYKDDIHLAKNISGVDIIVGGHSHSVLRKPSIVNDIDNKPVIVLQAGEMGKMLGDLKVQIEDDEVSLSSYKMYTIDSKIKEDEEINNDLKSFNNK
ncbi:MAG: metallophosphoesterase, partial [Cyanobacteriota bacterium]